MVGVSEVTCFSSGDADEKDVLRSPYYTMYRHDRSLHGHLRSLRTEVGFPVILGTFFYPIG